MKHIITFLLSILFVHLSLYSQNDEIELLESLINDAEIVYNDNQDASEAALEYLFYEIEKARETRVFGTDSEIILAQTRLSKAIETFLNVVNIDSVIANAYSFILNSTAEDDIKLAFEAIVDNANDLVNEPDVSFDTIPYLAERIVEATNLVNSIVTAVNYSSQLAAVDTRLSDGLQISIDQAKTLIMNLAGSPDDFNMAAYKLDETIELIKQILTATSLIDNTEDFEEAKTALNDVIEANIIVLANTGSTGADIDVAIENMINAIIIFKETTQTGEVQIILKNPGFEDNVQNWTVSTDDQSGWGVYIDTVNGVDGSRDLSFWSGVDYTGIASQSLINLPNGMYEISLMAIVTADNCFTLFGQSDGNLVETQLLFEDWTYTKRKIQIEVTDGTLIFGFKGSADGNLIPANQWARIDNFEIKLLPDIIIDNPGFEQDMTGWTVITDDQSGWGVYIDATNGVGGSQDLSFWSGVDYTGIASQSLINLPNGMYEINLMAIVTADNCFTLFGESGGNTVESELLFEDWTYTKRKMQIEVTDGTLTFGFKGSGTDNLIPANEWARIDNFSLKRLPDIKFDNPDFEQGMLYWNVLTNDQSGYGVYIDAVNGIDGSQNLSFWSGSDYTGIASYSLSNLLNGIYEISAMFIVSVDNQFILFGQSGASKSEQLLLFEEGTYTSRKIQVEVIDGTLEFGVKGAGDGNSILANSWTRMDNFVLQIKSITAEYDVKKEGTNSLLEKSLALEEELESSFLFLQNGNMMTIIAPEKMIRIEAFSFLGSKIMDITVNSETSEFSLDKGMFILKISTESGIPVVRKVMIR